MAPAVFGAVSNARFKHRDVAFPTPALGRRLRRGDVRAVRVGGGARSLAFVFVFVVVSVATSAARAARQRDGAYGRRRAQATRRWRVRAPHVVAERLEAVRRERVRPRNPRTESPRRRTRHRTRVRLNDTRRRSLTFVRRGDSAAGLTPPGCRRGRAAYAGALGCVSSVRRRRASASAALVHDPGRLREHFSEILAEEEEAKHAPEGPLASLPPRADSGDALPPSSQTPRARARRDRLRTTTPSNVARAEARAERARAARGDARHAARAARARGGAPRLKPPPSPSRRKDGRSDRNRTRRRPPSIVRGGAICRLRLRARLANSAGTIAVERSHRSHVPAALPSSRSRAAAGAAPRRSLPAPRHPAVRPIRARARSAARARAGAAGSDAQAAPRSSPPPAPPGSRQRSAGQLSGRAAPSASCSRASRGRGRLKQSRVRREARATTPPAREARRAPTARTETRSFPVFSSPAPLRAWSFPRAPGALGEVIAANRSASIVAGSANAPARIGSHACFDAAPPSRNSARGSRVAADAVADEPEDAEEDRLASRFDSIARSSPRRASGGARVGRARPTPRARTVDRPSAARRTRDTRRRAARGGRSSRRRGRVVEGRRASRTAGCVERERHPGATRSFSGSWAVVDGGEPAESGSSKRREKNQGRASRSASDCFAS